MAKKFVCPECDAEVMDDRESMLIEKVQEHAKSAHDMELDEEDIRDGIEDT